MGLFKKGRNRSQSTISATSQPLLPDSNHDAFFLPGNNHVYLTHSKDGKPALGRKKPNNVLQDFGFDILGQSFGIPSRRDYESLASQSSGLITAPATPRPRQEAQRPNVNRQAYSYEDTKSPMVRRKTSSARSSSTPATTTMVQYSNPDISNSQRHNTYRTSSPFLGPLAPNQYHIPPPPPPPSAVNWHRYPTVNTGVAPIPMSHSGAATRPIPSHPYNGLPMPHGAQNWAIPQHHMMAQYPNALGVIMPQPVAMPIMPHHQQLSQAQSTQIPYNQALPAAHPLSIPPPPPPQYWLRARAMTTKKEEIPQQETNHISGAGKVAKQHKEAENVSRSATQAHERLKSINDIKEHLSKRIFHVHVCAGCGKKRSSRYQKAHPLKRGEIPALNYCYSCLKDAADGDRDSFDRNAVHNPSKENRREPTVPWPSSDEGQAILDGKYAYKKSRRGPRRVKKSNHLGALSKLFSRRAPPGLFAPPPISLSSAEESSSRASSYVSDSCAVHPVRKKPVSQSRRAYEKKSNVTIQEEVKTSALPRQRYSSVNSWIAKQNSPLIPAENEPNRTNDEDKVRTASNSKPTLPQPHSRVSRSRPPPTLVDFDNPFQAANNSARKPSEECSSSYLYANDVARMAPTSHIAGLSEILNQVVLNETQEAAKLANARDDIKKGRKKGDISSSKVANPANARVAQGTHLTTPTSDCLRTHVIFNERANSSKNPFIQGFRSGGSQNPLDWNSEIDPEQPAGFNPLPNPGNSARWSVNDNAAAVPDEPKFFLNSNEPLTPKDVPYADHIHPPRVVNDSWSDFHTDLEREAEEMAERDLAFAGKLFDSLSGSLGGSATSAFPTTSFVTRSNISIVSCNSDSDHSDNDTTTPSVKEAEVQNDVDGTEANKSFERIEFSSEEERQNSARLKTLTDSFIAYHEHQDRYIKLPPAQSNNMNNQLENGQDDDDDVEWPPSPIGSSLVGHTGHSVDGLQNHASIQEDSATARDCHHLRRFAWLPSA
ncbi:hypothetical protein FHL15_000856 [Xylaria flabelliformis]|uniref:Stc1 domain-containing protein n=1 Tax=Xylaria flabelliformis TaxID=2512241 RepID=A0A553IDE8_9PEZI|nr:hypothetical protein FHL15_000856 [Xylaria flabelliformis]